MIENYEIDQFGVIHQIEYEPITYDNEYISYYERLSDRTIKLGYQRLGWILGLLDRIPDSFHSFHTCRITPFTAPSPMIPTQLATTVMLSAPAIDDSLRWSKQLTDL